MSSKPDSPRNADSPIAPDSPVAPGRPERAGGPERAGKAERVGTPSESTKPAQADPAGALGNRDHPDARRDQPPGERAHPAGAPDNRDHLRELARLRRVRDRIDREFAQPLDVEALARGVHMSAGHLSRQFRRAYGEPPYRYLMTRRIERAMALLRRGDLSVTEVCFAVGFSSLGTFSTRFTELVGSPPSSYQRQESDKSGKGEMPSCVTKHATRPVRNREAERPERT